MTQQIICSGKISVVNGSSFECLNDDSSASGTWIFVDVSLPFDPSQIDPLICTQLYGAGFLLFFTPWVCAWGFSQMLKLLR